MGQTKLIDGKYEYFAFISYKDEGKDAETAKWLQHKLEHYKLPVAIRKERPDLPERISPIYEYKSEAGSGRLKDVLWQGLTNSKYLIVICSPRATKSEWLNKGIRYFVENGLEENIIPFIIEGKPKADKTDEECFPSELLNLTGERELRGININDVNDDFAAITVIARMFDLKVNTLWKRYEREQKKQRNEKYGFILGVITLMAIASITFALIVSDKNKQLNNANIEIIKERDRANAEKYKAEKANASLIVANESISHQKTKLQEAFNNLERSQNLLSKSNFDLNERNIQLKEEKERIVRINKELLLSQSRYKAKEARNYIHIGNCAEAYRIIKDCYNSGYYDIETDAAARVLYDTLSKSGYKSFSIVKCENIVEEASLSPDGKTVVMGDRSGVLEIYDTQYFGIKKKLKAHKSQIASITFSNDGTIFATASHDDNENLKLWETVNYTCIKEVPIKGVRHIQFRSDDKQMLFSLDDSLAVVWNVNEDKPQKILRHKQNAIVDARYSNDNSIIVTTMYMGGCCLWDASTGNFIKQLDFYPSLTVSKTIHKTNQPDEYQPGFPYMHSCVFTPDDNYLVIPQESGNVLFYDYRNDIIKDSCKVHKGSIHSLNYNEKCNAYITSSVDGTGCIWTPQDSIYIHLKGHTGSVTNGELSRDGNVALTVSGDMSIRIWKKEKLEDTGFFGYLDHLSEILAVSSTSDIVACASSHDSLVYVVDPVERRIIKELSDHHSNINSVSFSGSGKKILTSSKDVAYLWNSDNYECILSVKTDTIEQEIVTSCYSPVNSNFAILFNNGKLRLYHSDSSIPYKTIDLPSEMSFDFKGYMNYSLDGSFLAICSSENAFAVDLANDTIKPISNNIEYSSGLSFSSNKMMIKSIIGNLYFYNISDWKSAPTFNVGMMGIRDALFSPDQQYIITLEMDNSDDGSILAFYSDDKDRRLLYSKKLYDFPHAMANDYTGKRIVADSGKGLLFYLKYKSIKELIDKLSEMFR